jgi:hypothetical protein
LKAQEEEKKRHKEEKRRRRLNKDMVEDKSKIETANMSPKELIQYDKKHRDQKIQ